MIQIPATNEAVVAAQKAAFAQAQSFSAAAVAGLEKLSALNLEVARAVLEQYATFVQSALSAKTVGDLAELQASAFQAAPEKLLAYGRDVKAIVDEATAGQRAAAQSQVADVQSKFVEAIDAMLKNAPGSEQTVALVKQAVSAANDAVANVQRAAEQAVATFEGQVEQAAAPVKARASRAKARA